MSELQRVIEATISAKRICPQPQKWDQLVRMLPRRGDEPLPPLILAAWWHTSDQQKRERFLDHLQYADEVGALDRVVAFLAALQTDDWHVDELSILS